MRLIHLIIIVALGSTVAHDLSQLSNRLHFGTRKFKFDVIDKGRPIMVSNAETGTIRKVQNPRFAFHGSGSNFLNKFQNKNVVEHQTPKIEVSSVKWRLFYG